MNGEPAQTVGGRLVQMANRERMHVVALAQRVEQRQPRGGHLLAAAGMQATLDDESKLPGSCHLLEYLRSSFAEACVLAINITPIGDEQASRFVWIQQ
jgi:hypothetical protein